MGKSGQVPPARAVGGLEESKKQVARRLFTRHSIVFDFDISRVDCDECICCRKPVARLGGLRSCRACVRHRLLYGLVQLALFAGLVALARPLRALVFDWLPFASKVVHTGLMLGAGLIIGFLCLAVLSLLTVPSGHCHLGSAKEMLTQSETGNRVLLRNEGLARKLADELGTERFRRVLEPRMGWTLTSILTMFLPVFGAAYAFLRFDASHFTLHVDNGSDMALTIRAKGHGVIGSVKPGEEAPIRLPRTAMTLVAESKGAIEDEIRVGGLDEILDGRYEPSLYPELEYDVADVFVWNLKGLRCYQKSRKSYGLASFGGGTEIHRKHVFHTDADELFQRAPSAIRSELPIETREELLRTPCR